MIKNKFIFYASLWCLARYAWGRTIRKWILACKFIQKFRYWIYEKKLIEFKENLIFHQGYIPDSLTEKPDPPDTIFYLHIDLNSAKPTEHALEFFYPRLVGGGVILFDDYGWDAYEDTKNTIENFFKDKPGLLMKIPTGQAIYFHN